MKLPALWAALAFAGGILLAEQQLISPRVALAAAGTLVAAGLLCLWRNRVVAAWALSLATWAALGLLAAQLEARSLPAHHVSVLAAGDSPAAWKLPLDEALRWRGRLRSDPLRLPWGLRYEIELEQAEVAGQPQPLAGGLRVSYYFNERAPEPLPALRAGDRVEALVHARPPRNFANPGSFDARLHLARLDIHLTATLRSTELLRKVDDTPPTLAHRAARVRGRLLDQVDRMFAASPNQAAVVRAMLLGDRSFLDHELAETFQKTGAYHVLVISGLHVAVLAAFVWWLGTALRLRPWLVTLLTVALLAAFVAIVEDRPPIERAALMAALFLLARWMFRQVELLHTVALSGLILLVARPSSLADPSFQLSFLAAEMIAALGLPWIELTSAAYRRALRHLDDVTHDGAHPPRAAQFRLDARAVSDWLAERLPRRLADRSSNLIALPCRAALRLWDVLVMTTAIQLGMLAVMAHYFHRVSLAGPLANIPAVLISGLMVPVGFVALGAGMASEWVGRIGGALLGWLTTALVESVTWFERWRGASYRLPGPPEWLLLAFFVALSLLAIAAWRGAQKEAKHPWRWQLAAAVPVVVCGVAIAVYPFAPALPPGELEATVLDVGQGDAVFVAFPDGRTLLVDGGGLFGTRRGGFRTSLDIGEQVVSPYLWTRGLKRLDAVALTHAHHDHLDGLFAVLDNFAVGELWLGREVDDRAVRALAARARARGTRVVTLRRGQSLDWGQVSVLVLWPEAMETASSASNNDSLVLRLESRAHTFLLAGDIEGKVEQDLVERGDPLDADFLKVPHHGSRTSATEGLVAAVTPAVAAISLGANNPFGHPHREVLDRLARPGVRLLRTDLDGAITVTSDGQRLRVHTYNRN